MKQHFRIIHDDDNIVWLHFDMADSSTNILTVDTLDELDQSLISIAQLHPKGLVLLSDKDNGFIAGADVKAFANVDKPAIANEQIRRAHHVFARLENFRFPTVAAIHGFCLGGGTELSLACDYRVGDIDTTRIGLPEVLLGIFPGFGGTARSTRLMGSFAAMNMMLSGRALRAKVAKKQGLLDLAVPRRHLYAAARQLIQQQPPLHQPSWINNIVELAPCRKLLSIMMQKEVGKKVQQQHYPAPYKLIKHWQQYGGDFDAMLSNEIDEVSKLICSETAQNLIRAFLLRDQLKTTGRQSDFKAKYVHVIGGGVMGGDIAAWCALRGLTVSIQDQNPEQLQNALGRARKLFKRRLKLPHLIQAASDRLIPDVAGHGAAKADVVIEAIFENVDAKVALYQQLEPKMKAEAILATNTSSIPLEVLNKDMVTPSRLVGLHFFNPVAQMQLVEIVHGSNTDPAVVNNAAAFAAQIDRLPLPVKSSPGFLVNRILMPYLLEAVTLLNEGIPARVIDKAAINFGMPMGPIELADTVGLDICLSVAQKLAESFTIDIPSVLQNKVNEGNIGKKSGHGYYQWKKGKAISVDNSKKYQAPKDIADRMIMRLLNEAVACLREGVVENEDLLDAGIIFGTGFAPFRGGPMHYIQKNGIQQMEKRLHQLKSHHGDKFSADDGWHAMA